jgi:hypothetical protein
MELNKMTRPTVRIHDITTDEVIDREMNDSEFAQWQAEQAEIAAAQAKIEAKAAEKQQILDQLGITAEQAKLLLS